MKSELQNDQLERQKLNSEELVKLEKEKGAYVKTRTDNPEYKPLKEDIIVGTAPERELLFETEKKHPKVPLTMTKWERNDLLVESEKYKEPESSEDYYSSKYQAVEPYNWSHQANLENFLEKIKSDLGDRDYNRLRDLFECYAGSVSPLQMGKIESYQFHCFMKDHDLYTDKLNRTQANLKFFAANKSKSVTFEGFSRILIDLALIKYPWEKNRSVAFPHFVKHYIF